jgi:hypothetical protein
MPDRRPVWLTEEQAKIVGDLLSAHVQGYSAELDAVVDPVLEQIEDDPEPWLTVDDNGRAMRIVPADAPCEAGLEGYYATWTLYRVVPVTQGGGE